jgi:hypothetical protein
MPIMSDTDIRIERPRGADTIKADADARREASTMSFILCGVPAEGERRVQSETVGAIGPPNVS